MAEVGALTTFNKKKETHNDKTSTPRYRVWEQEKAQAKENVACQVLLRTNTRYERVAPEGNSL